MRKHFYKITFLLHSKGILHFMFITLFAFWGHSLAAQTIRGKVIDAGTGEPVEWATIVLKEKSNIGTVTDSLGRFKLTDIPIGRYTIEASYVGFDPSIFKEVMVSSAKEVYLEFQMREDTKLLSEVIIRPRVNKELPLNNMALAGARMFSVEEASRYAGGFDDPARLAGCFAGVASGTNDNGISVHGNAPHLLLWRLEGIEVPTPSHFAEAFSVGNGLISALSSQVMGNSDFLSGAFPAEYSNALS